MMAFEFSVDSAGRLPSANVVYLDGMLKSGTILEGAVAIVKGDQQKHVTIKSVALVNSKETEENRLTLAIDDPSFPLEDLEGVLLIEQTQCSPPPATSPQGSSDAGASTLP